MPNEKRRSLRARMITLVLIPSTALLALWALLTTTLAGDIGDLRTTATLIEEVGSPTTDVIDRLQRERRATLAALNSPTSSTQGRLDEARAATDQAVLTLDRSLNTQDGATLPRQATAFQNHLTSLEDHRAQVDALPHDADTLTLAAGPYTELIETGLRVWGALVERADATLSPHLRSLTSLTRTRELLNRQDTILAHAVATNEFTAQAHAEFAAAVGAQRHTWSRVDAEAGEEAGRDFVRLDGSAQMETVELLQDTVIATPGRGRGSGVPVNAQTWQGAAEALDRRMSEVERERRDHVVALGHRHAADLRDRALIITVPTLLVALASVGVAMVGTQRLGARLQELRTRTLEHARDRLPQVTARLRAGQEVDVDAEVPPLNATHHDEIGQVASAFDDARRAAVTAAVEEARVRAGVRYMFRNLARRTQSLVHRQLSLLDRVEREETDPQVLEALFRIDHLSTQMRRNAENLMLLSGDRPTRHGAAPVGLHEAVRASAGEIEDYTRVQARTLPPVALRGGAGADLVRLLAELLENATSFSPPDTPVIVEGDVDERGRYRILVRDQGLGMTEERVRVANTLLADPPRFDLARVRDDSQLGLYVVAVIAARHGFEVRVDSTPGEGTVAVVEIPADMVVEPAHTTGPMRVGHLGVAPAPPSDRDVAPAMAPVRGRDEVPEPQALPPLEEGPDTHMGLPRRRRRVVADPPPASETATVPRRSLDQIRTMMGAFQTGTERARALPDREGADPVEQTHDQHEQNTER
ncbi:sensor histidine kinase [Nocardiopsis alba]|uniref:sensor histidine kinase n=1 Tax=Nocardiopsis alba TaxID=53437 RepID=UPI003D714890